jgi:hypothetical protein
LDCPFVPFVFDSPTVNQRVEMTVTASEEFRVVVAGGIYDQDIELKLCISDQVPVDCPKVISERFTNLF